MWLPPTIKGSVWTWTKMIHKFGELQVDGITRDEFNEFHDCAICGGGNCCGVATGNTGAIFTEALGLTLPGCGSFLMVQVKRLRDIGDAQVRR